MPTIVIVDASASVGLSTRGGTTKFNTLREGLGHFLDRLGEQFTTEAVELVACSTHPEVVVSFTHDFEEIRSGFETMSCKGRSNLRDALHLALDCIGHRMTVEMLHQIMVVVDESCAANAMDLLTNPVPFMGPVRVNVVALVTTHGQQIAAEAFGGLAALYGGFYVPIFEPYDGDAASEAFDKVLARNYARYEGLIALGNVNWPIRLLPDPNLSSNQERRTESRRQKVYTSVVGAIPPVMSIIGFLPLSTIASPTVTHEFAIIPQDGAVEMAVFATSLHEEQVAAVVSCDNYVGVVLASDVSSSKATALGLFLCVLPPEMTVPWLGAVSSLSTQALGTAVPVPPWCSKSYMDIGGDMFLAPLLSEEAISKHAKKLCTLARGLPQTTDQFYESLNRFRCTASMYGVQDLATSLSVQLEEQLAKRESPSPLLEDVIAKLKRGVFPNAGIVEIVEEIAMETS